MSLLKANGHPEAADYPIGMVADEAGLIVEQVNGQLATLGVIIQSATMTTGMGASKEAVGHFRDLINGLNGD